MKNKKSVPAIACCPKCKSKEVLGFEGDFFCTDCSWDSLEMSVKRGDLDDALYSYEDDLAKRSGLATNVPLIASMSKDIDGSAA